MNNTTPLVAAENLQLGMLATAAADPNGGSLSREMMCSIMDIITLPTVKQLILLGGHTGDYENSSVIMIYDILADHWSISETSMPLLGGYSHWTKIFRVTGKIWMAASRFHSLLINRDGLRLGSQQYPKFAHDHMGSPRDFNIHEGSSVVMLNTEKAMVFNAGPAGVGNRRLHCVLHFEGRRWIKKSTSMMPGYDACCVVMKDGRVLVVGGSRTFNSIATTDCCVYYPVSNRFLRTTSLREARMGAAGCLLDDGRVFVCSGRLLSGSCEIFNPADCTWSDAGTLLQPRRHHVCFHIMDSMIFVAGGIGFHHSVNWGICEMYDITTQTSTLIEKSPVERMHMAVIPIY